MFLQSLFKTLLGEHLSSIVNRLIHPRMGDIGKLLSDMQMNGSHLSIVKLYLSTHSVLLYEICIIFPLKFIYAIYYTDEFHFGYQSTVTYCKGCTL
jgi:hypothetical protein